jgi:hypothetical protein
MPASDCSSKIVPPASPFCPTCGKEMSLTGVAPTSGNTIFEYLCSNDGDRLSWQPHHWDDGAATQIATIAGIPHPTQ